MNIKLASAIASAVLCVTGAQAGVVYSNNFSSGAGSEWSNSTTSTTPGTVSHAADKFLGELANETDTLSLTGLAAHNNVTVEFDLYMIRSQDGNGQFGGGPDNWYLFVPGAAANYLVATNFANYPGNTQAYPGSIAPIGAGASNPAGTGATEINTLGYEFNGPMDSVYHFSLTFASTDANLSLAFQSTENEGINNESWGLDNVVVSTDAVAGTATPEPATFGLGIVALGTLGLFRRRAARR